jgi:LPS export ABC transporter protein LptC
MSRSSWLGLMLILLVVAVLVWQSSQTPGGANESVSSSQPRYRIENLRALRTDDQGTPLVRLTAATADYYDGGAASLTQIEAVGLSGEAAPWALKAPTGTVTAGEKRLLLHAPVSGTGRWNTGEQFQFAGSAVWVDDEKRQFYSNQPIEIDSPSRTARAKGFTAGFDGKTLQMTQPELSYVFDD